MCEAVWNIKQVIDDAIKIAQLTTTFRDRALTWYMKYNQQARTLGQIKTTLVQEFKKPESESQCITQLKEIKQKPTELVWEFDQKFKTLLDHLSFDIGPQQRKEWFIVVLLPHIRLPLTQQKVVDQAEALEVVMKLEASPLQEASAGMTQIQSNGGYAADNS